MAIVTRFAPSPTGDLHLGHAYSASLSFRFAAARGGDFLLRFEDIDQSRCREPYYQRIQEDLSWLGIHSPREPLRQSRRFPLYKEALQSLQERGLVYPCFCSRKEVAQALAAPHALPSQTYARTCRSLSPDTVNSLLSSPSKKPCWRFDAQKAAQQTGPLTYYDSRQGERAVHLAPVGDLIIGRKDLFTSYHLSVVIDDAAQGVTDVIRGCDLLSFTPLHRTLQALLGLPTPRYHHHRLIKNPHGKRLAKRDQDQTLRALRDGGMSPEAVRAQLAPFEQFH